MGGLLNQVQTSQSHIRRSMLEIFGDTRHPTALTQEDVQELIQHMHLMSSGTETTAAPLIGNMDINVSEVPTNPVPVDCIPTTKCTLASNPNCQKLKDRFILVQSGIRDKRDEFDQALKDKIDFCDDQERQYNEQIDNLNQKLREENTKLAQGTQDQNEAETGSHQSATQHKEAATEYVRSMKECCD